MAALLFIIFFCLQGLTSAANILLHGAERLKVSHSDTTRVKSNQDFHLELLRLRQNWILKKMGNSILGDLSYKSAGSRFHHSGIFEVSKSEDPPTPGSNPEVTMIDGQTKPSMIKVTIPTELEGTAYIQVTIQKGGAPITIIAHYTNKTFLNYTSCFTDQDILCHSNLSFPHSSLRHTDPPRNVAHPWASKLEAAQNVLFCKELFSHLAREAVQLQAQISPLVVGTQITASVLIEYLF